MDIQFGQYRLKRAERLLLGRTGPVELSARSFDILEALVGKPAGVLSKSDLFDAAWPGMIVEDNTLQVHISALRKALDPSMIVTVHGRGYKYVGPLPVEVDGAEPAVSLQRPPSSEAQSATRYRPVIAVFPFANMSSDPGQDYFGEGITEDIIVELSRNRSLRVVSRNSSSRFKGPAIDISDAGRQLGAHYVVEGSVRKVGNGVRVTAQLLETASASHVWAERYDRQLLNVFAVQDELVRKIVSTIVGRVEIYADSLAQAKRTESLDAYDCWLRANRAADLWTVEGNVACERLLEEAIKKDPLFARAHASLAFCNIRTATLSPGSPEIRAFEEAALRKAEHAVRLDPSEARTHNAVGWSQMYLRSFERAKSAFMMSASLNPNDGSACIDRALALSFLGEQAAAEDAVEIAATLNPLGGEWFSCVQAYVHYMAKRYDAAETHFALTSEQWPDVHAWHAANLVRLGRPSEALERMQAAFQRLSLIWCGPAAMIPEDFMVWFRHNNMLRRDEDWTHLYGALLEAGAPAVPS